jgi:hypothetical protein
MDVLPAIHDGSLDGFWISENKSVHIFLRTITGERSTLVLNNVERMNVSNFRQGNLLFDLEFVEADKMTLALIEQVYELEGAQLEAAQRLLGNAQQRGLSTLMINSSYGAEGVVLFRGAEILQDHVLRH